MSAQESPPISQVEVLEGLQAFVGENLILLPIDEAWQPTDYLPDLTAENWRERLGEFRGPASELSDAVLVVLVLALPTGIMGAVERLASKLKRAS